MRLLTDTSHTDKQPCYHHNQQIVRRTYREMSQAADDVNNTEPRRPIGLENDVRLVGRLVSRHFVNFARLCGVELFVIRAVVSGFPGRMERCDFLRLDERK